jgi:hypothetical protein
MEAFVGQQESERFATAALQSLVIDDDFGWLRYTDIQTAW